MRSTCSSQAQSVWSLAAIGSPAAGRTCHRDIAPSSRVLSGTKSSCAATTTGRAPVASSSAAAKRSPSALPRSVKAQPVRPANPTRVTSPGSLVVEEQVLHEGGVEGIATSNLDLVGHARDAQRVQDQQVRRGRVHSRDCSSG